MSNIFSFFTKKIRKKKNYSIGKRIRKEKNDFIDITYLRHLSPANIEWSNSIYVYNKNYLKVLPSFDKMITNFIKSYFYLQKKKKQKNSISRRMRIRLRRLSVNRIIVSKAEIKHTNSKAIVTIFIYNAEKRYLVNKINKINKKQKIKYFSIESIKSYSLFEKLKFFLLFFKTIDIKQKNKKLFNWYFKNLNYRNRNRASKRKKLLKNLLKRQGKTVIKSFIKKLLRKEKLYQYYKYLLWINKSKFEKTYIYPLNKLIKNFYNKKIEFNLVNLKYLHLNSDILTESIAIKLKNRKNSIRKILRFCLSKIKLPNYYLDNEVFKFRYLTEKKKTNVF